MREIIRLSDVQSGYLAFRTLWPVVKDWLQSGRTVTVDARTDTRSLAQNRLMWACLGDLERQMVWGGNRFDATGWKDFITANLHGQAIVPNIDGNGFVAVGRSTSTSDMTIAEMTEVIDLSHAFGDLQGVQWSPTSLGRDWPEDQLAHLPASVRAKRESATTERTS